MAATKSKRRIFLVEDHPIVSQGLTCLLNQQDDLTVCGHADNHVTALEEIERQKPDIVLMDVTLRTGNGIDLLKTLKAYHSKLPVLMLSMHDENLYAIRATRAGASGYIMKQESADKVIAAVRQVLGGEIYLSEAMERKLRNQFFTGRSPKTGSPLEDLTDRELEIFGLIGQGFGTRQIAERLHLSIKTIESHRAHIKEKLNLNNSMELVQHAIQWKSA